jgi:hypothetical protein
MVAATRTLRVLDPDARARFTALASRPTAAAERTLEVHPALTALLPHGLTRGTSVACQGSAAMSTAWLLTSAASQAGAWVGIAGLSDLGIQAGREAGTVIERVVLVREPSGRDGSGRDGSGRSGHSRDERWSDDLWGQVLAALIDGFDLVVLGAAARIRPATARRVQARLRARGAVLLVVGQTGGFACDLEVHTASTWHGLGDGPSGRPSNGHGHLRSRQVEVTVQGRRMQRPRRDTLWFPSVDGQIVPVQTQHEVALDDVTVDTVAVAGVTLSRTG